MNKLFASIIALAVTAAAFGAETYQQAIKAGYQSRAKRKYTEAAEFFDKAAKLSKNQREKYNALCNKGTALGHSRKFADAVATLQEAYKIAPAASSKSFCAYYTGYYLYVEKKYDQAVAELEKSKENVKKQSDIDRANYLIARIYLIQKKNKEAYDLALKVTSSKNKSMAFNAWDICLDVSYRAKDKAKAKAALDKMAELSKSFPADYYLFRMHQQSYTYYTNIDRNLEKALAAADKIASNPKFSKQRIAYGVYFKAHVYNLMKKKDLAKEHWQIVAKCGVKNLENIAKNQLKRMK